MRLRLRWMVLHDRLLYLEWVLVMVLVTFNALSVEQNLLKQRLQRQEWFEGC